MGGRACRPAFGTLPARQPSSWRRWPRSEVSTVWRKSPLAMITTGSPPKRSRYLLVASYELDDLSTSVSVLVDGWRLVSAIRAPPSDNSATTAMVSSGRLAAAAVMRAKRVSIGSKGYGTVVLLVKAAIAPTTRRRRGFTHQRGDGAPPCARTACA